MYTTSRGYLFAHQTLLAAAQDELGRDIDAYWERVHAWAETYERRGWPENTPLYLLQPYGRLVALLRDTGRATALATDVRRRDRLREVTGSDAACLAEIAAARETVRRVTPDDLGTLAVLAVVEDMVARRNESLHPDIPAVYVRLGRIRQAIGLARSVYQPMERALAVAGVARVLADSGDRRAVGLAEEAVRLAEGVSRRWMLPDVEANTVAARGVLAIALARVDRPDEAMRGLRELPRPQMDSALRTYGNALITTAEALGDPESAAVLLRKAEETTGWFDSVLDRACGLVRVGEVYSARGFSADAERLYESVRELARGQGEGAESLSAIAAYALRETCPDEAKALAAQAAEELGIDGRPVHGGATHSAVLALVAMDRMTEAHQLARSVGGPVRVIGLDSSSDTWLLIAEGWARRGAAAEVWAALEARRNSSLVLVHDYGSTARVIDLLTGAGAAEQVEALLLDMTDSAPTGVTREDLVEALGALAGHFAADDPQRSLKLLHRAEHGCPSVAGPVHHSQHVRLAILAGSLATAGLSDEAEQLVATIDEPSVRAWGCAVVSMALVGHDTSRALRLAEQAVRLGRGIRDLQVMSGPMTAVVQALAWAGAARRVGEVISDTIWAGGVYDGDRARVEAASGLWPHDPRLAGRFVDEVLRRTPGGDVARAAQILVALWPDDSWRRAHIKELAFDTQPDRASHWDRAYDWNRAYPDGVLLVLLTATTDPTAAKVRLDALTVAYERSEPPTSHATGGGALAYAALGDNETARAIAQREDDEERRAKALAQLAAYAACLPGDRVPVPLLDDVFDITLLARRLATLLLPPPSGPDLPKARALLTEALTPCGWHHALPVLAAIDPDAVHRVRDVVFAHLGLSD